MCARKGKPGTIDLFALIPDREPALIISPSAHPSPPLLWTLPQDKLLYKVRRSSFYLPGYTLLHSLRRNPSAFWVAVEDRDGPVPVLWRNRKKIAVHRTNEAILLTRVPLQISSKTDI